MKKKFWMIVMIVLVILFIPRYNTSSHQSNANKWQRYPHRNVLDETDDFEFPLPGKWLLINTLPEIGLCKQYALNSTSIHTGLTYNRYMPSQAGPLQLNL